MTKKKVSYFKMFNKIIHSMGYRKYYYSSFGNEYKQSIEKTKTFILPTFLNATYDDRSCRKSCQETGTSDVREAY